MVGDVCRRLMRTTFESALLSSGETDSPTVVDRLKPELKNYEGQFPNSGNDLLRKIIEDF
jgi:hypothetical protein